MSIKSLSQKDPVDVRVRGSGCQQPLEACLVVWWILMHAGCTPPTQSIETNARIPRRHMTYRRRAISDSDPHERYPTLHPAGRSARASRSVPMRHLRILCFALLICRAVAAKHQLPTCSPIAAPQFQQFSSLCSKKVSFRKAQRQALDGVLQCIRQARDCQTARCHLVVPPLTKGTQGQKYKSLRTTHQNPNMELWRSQRCPPNEVENVAGI